MNAAAHLREALAAAEAEDRLGLLEHLLEAWRETRAPGLADIIGVVGADLDRSLAPVGESGPGGERAKALPSQRARHERWLDLCDLGRAADVTRLAAALADSNGPLGKEKMERLRNVPHDPRLAEALVAEILRPGGWTNVPRTFHQVFGYLSEARDVRGLSRLRQKLEGARGHPRRVGLTERRERGVEVLSTPPPPLSEEARDLLARVAVVARQLSERPPCSEAEVLANRRPVPGPVDANEERLLEMVFENPTDDTARLVYGDWLSERGLPRGELIALQYKRLGTGLTAKDEKRERELLKEHVRTWLGPLEPVVDLGKRPGQLGSVVFERGFLARCRTAFKSATQREALAADRRWATCSTLFTDEPSLIAHPQMKALRVVGELPLSALASLVEDGKVLGLEELGLNLCRVRKGAPALLRSPQARQCMPGLKRILLDLSTLGKHPSWQREWDLFALARSPLFQGLDEVRIEVGGEAVDVATWLDCFEAHPPQRLVLADPFFYTRWRLEAVRTPEGWSLVLSGLPLEPHLPLTSLEGLNAHDVALTLELPTTWPQEEVDSWTRSLSKLSPVIRRVSE